MGECPYAVGPCLNQNYPKDCFSYDQEETEDSA